MDYSIDELPDYDMASNDAPSPSHHILWLAVILQALKDARCELEGPGHELHRRRAKAWVHSQDFKLVCIYAGVPESQVRKIISDPKEKCGTMGMRSINKHRSIYGKKSKESRPGPYRRWETSFAGEKVNEVPYHLQGIGFSIPGIANLAR